MVRDARFFAMRPLLGRTSRLNPDVEWWHNPLPRILKREPRQQSVKLEETKAFGVVGVCLAYRQEVRQATLVVEKKVRDT